MKKSIKIVFLLVIGLLVTGCGNTSSGTTKKETSTYINRMEGLNLSVTFTHSGDKLLKVEQTMEYPLEHFGIEKGQALDDELKTQIEEQVSSMYDGYQDGKGTSLTAKFTEESLFLDMSVDLEKADQEAISALINNGGNSKNISFKKTVEDFEAEGFKEKK